MSFVLSLISGAPTFEVSSGILDKASRLCDENASACGPWRWLADAYAAECHLEKTNDNLLSALRHAMADLPIDINIIPEYRRRKALLVSDMDATAIEGETLDVLSGYTPFKQEIDDLTRQSVEGSLSFTQSLIRRVGLLKGLDQETLEKTHAQMRLSPGLKILVATMRKNGALTALVSGGFRYFTAKVKAESGFDIDIANDLELQEGRLTGRLLPPIIDPEAKAEALQSMVRHHGLDPSLTLAVGDGFNDVFMLKSAGLGIAYRGKPRVKQIIAHQINYGDLRSLLYLQAYHRDEFVDSAD